MSWPAKVAGYELLYQSFLAQTYHADNLELVIFDNGSNRSLFFGSQNLDRFIYHHIPPGAVYLGQQHQWLAEQATGEIIVHWTDHDFYGRDYVMTMVEPFLSRDELKLRRLIYWPMANFGTGRKFQFNFAYMKDKTLESWWDLAMPTKRMSLPKMVAV